MSIRKTIVALALVGATLPAAFANTGTIPATAPKAALRSSKS